MSSVSPTSQAATQQTQPVNPPQNQTPPQPTPDQQQAQQNAPAQSTLNLFGVGTQVNSGG
jgi:hypothetical protein